VLALDLPAPAATAGYGTPEDPAPQPAGRPFTLVTGAEAQAGSADRAAESGSQIT